MRVLLVEDDPIFAKYCARELRQARHDVTIAPCLVAARAALARCDSPEGGCRAEPRDQAFDVVLLDLRLPDGDGAALLPLVEQLERRPTVVVTSAHADAVAAVELWPAITLALRKPFDLATLILLLEKIEVVRGQSRPTLARDAVMIYARRFRLSGRHAQVIEGVLRGESEKETAARLQVARATVDVHRRRICRRMKCTWQAVIGAVRELADSRTRT